MHTMVDCLRRELIGEIHPKSIRDDLVCPTEVTARIIVDLFTFAYTCTVFLAAPTVSVASWEIAREHENILTFLGRRANSSLPARQVGIDSTNGLCMGKRVDLHSLDAGSPVVHSLVDIFKFLAEFKKISSVAPPERYAGTRCT